MCAAWNITEKELKRMQASDMRFIRAIRDKTRWNRIRNEELRKRIIIEYSLREKAQKTRLQWFGHVKRMKVDRIPRKISYKGKR